MNKGGKVFQFTKTQSNHYINSSIIYYLRAKRARNHYWTILQFNRYICSKKKYEFTQQMQPTFIHEMRLYRHGLAHTEEQYWLVRVQIIMSINDTSLLGSHHLQSNCGHYGMTGPKCWASDSNLHHQKHKSLNYILTRMLFPPIITHNPLCIMLAFCQLMSHQ